MGRLRERNIAVVEADLHLYAGRIEVRHLKTLGPVPVLWDRWTLAAPWAPRLRLDRVLAAMRPGTELMLDLKGRDPRLPALVAAALGEHATGARVMVCARHWPLLDLLPRVPVVRPVHSVGGGASSRACAVASTAGGWMASRSIASSSMRGRCRTCAGARTSS